MIGFVFMVEDHAKYLGWKDIQKVSIQSISMQNGDRLALAGVSCVATVHVDICTTKANVERNVRFIHIHCFVTTAIDVSAPTHLQFGMMRSSKILAE